MREVDQVGRKHELVDHRQERLLNRTLVWLHVQRLAFLSDDGLKAKATALISRLGHRDRTMWFAMWRSFARESIYNRRDRVIMKAREELEKMTEERDYMLW